MAELRVSQTFAGLFADWDPAIRVATFYVEAVVDANPTLRVATHWVEYVADHDPLIRVTQYHLEVLYSESGIGIFVPEQSPVDIFPKRVPSPYGEKWVGV